MGPVQLTNADGRGLYWGSGCDFLVRHGMVINFEKGTFRSRESMPLKGRVNLTAAKSCILTLDGDCPQAASFKDNTASEWGTNFPEHHPALGLVL